MQRSRVSVRIARPLIAGVVIAMLFAACGGDDDDSSSSTSAPSSTTTTTEDVCAQADALRSSVEDLKSVDLVAEGTNGATAAVNAVKDDLAAVSESVSDELRPDVQAVEDSVDELQTAVDKIDTDGAGGGARCGREGGHLGEHSGHLARRGRV